jgi:hypothetical protein
MRMQGLCEGSFAKALRRVEADRDQSLPEIFSVHPDKGVEGLFASLELHEDAKFPLEEVQQPVTDHPVEAALLLDLLLHSLF